MLRFKHFLLKEYLTADEKSKVASWEPRTPEATAATDHYFGHGKEDKHEELEGTKDKSEIHKAIERHLGQEIPHDHYKAGQTTDKYGRQARIGGMLNKSKAPSELARGFENDSTRQGKNLSGLTVHTTRSAEGVAGQTSHGQSWEQQSCKNIVDGGNNHYLPHEVKHGTVVSYLKDKDGKELARATFHPHHNAEGNTVYKKDSYYGIKHAGFMAHNDKTEKELSQPHKGSLLYKKHPDVYDDSGEKETLHPNANNADVDAAQKSSDIETRKAAIHHKNVTPEHISKALNDTDDSVREAAIQHPKATSEHISKALNDSAYHIRAAAAIHPNATPEHISKALNDSTYDVRGAAAMNPNATPEHISKALTDKQPYVRSSAFQSKHITHDQIENGLKDENYIVRGAAAMNPNATPEHISKGLSDESHFVRHRAIFNPNASHEHISKALNDETSFVRSAAVQHQNATPDHFKKALNDTDEQIRKFAKTKLGK